MTYHSVPPTGDDGFGRLLRAEWTKLRSVPRWVLAMLSAVVLAVLISVMSATASGSDVNDTTNVVVGPEGQPVDDSFHFVHRPLSGDGSLTAEVVAQDDSHEWAKAGVMIKASTAAGSPYAAVMVTPDHGVRMQSNFTTDLPGSAEAAPHWLRLSRSGDSITAYESADGATWNEIGTVEFSALPGTVEAGLFVASPDLVEIERQFGSIGVGQTATIGTATFDNVGIEPSPDEPARWQSEDVGHALAEPGAFSESGGMFTVTGSGDIAPNPPDDDVVLISLSPGVIIGLLVLVTVSVLYITSEYKRGMILTSFIVSPRRGRVLAAKAIVLGSTTFVVGLVASVLAFLFAQPILRSNGFAPPAIPRASLSDPIVLRAVVGSAALLALAAVLSLGLGAILRRSAGSITLAIALLIVPLLVGTAVPPMFARWLMRLTPAGGFSIQSTVDRSDTAFEPWAMIGPWTGLAVLAGYAAVTLAFAWWLLRRRDT